MQTGKNIYKLKNGKAKGDWKLPIKNQYIEKIVDGKSVGLRALKYVPGTGSFFAEDIHKELKPVSIWFKDGQIEVPVSDKLTNELLQKHSWFGIHYELHDENAKAQRELEVFEQREKALDLIKVHYNDELKIRAVALAALGREASGWTATVCKAELKKEAFNNPGKIIKSMQASNYQSKYLAALAFYNNIIKTDDHKNNVVWADETQAVILRLAKGENGIDKLGDFLASGTEESNFVLQEIGVRQEKLIQNYYADAPKAVKSEAEIRAEIEADLKADFDRKFEELKQQLTQNAPVNNEPLNLASTTITGEKQMFGAPYNPADLSSVREEYRKVVGNIPPNKNNDIEWLVAKIEATKATA